MTARHPEQACRRRAVGEVPEVQAAVDVGRREQITVEGQRQHAAAGVVQVGQEPSLGAVAAQAVEPDAAALGAARQQAAVAVEGDRQHPAVVTGGARQRLAGGHVPAADRAFVRADRELSTVGAAGHRPDAAALDALAAPERRRPGAVREVPDAHRAVLAGLSARTASAFFRCANARFRCASRASSLALRCARCRTSSAVARSPAVSRAVAGTSCLDSGDGCMANAGSANSSAAVNPGERTVFVSKATSLQQLRIPWGL